MRRALMIGLLLSAACGEERIVLRPAIDVPAASSDAYPYDVVDTLRLSIAHEGEEDDIASATGTPDDPPSLDNIPFDDDLVLHLSGVASDTEVAYGRSCPFSVPADNLEPHIYFSRIVKWASGADPGGAGRTRFRGQVHPFGCGTVFLGGGDPDADIDLFDPTIGDFQRLQVDLMRRSRTVVAPMADGRALIVGGADAGDNLVDDVEVVNLSGALVDQFPGGGPAVEEHAAVVLQDGSVLVSGGRTDTTVTNEVWRFALGEMGFEAQPFEEGMLQPRAGHTMTRLSDELGAGVLIVGGRDAGDNLVETAELYRPLQDEFIELAIPLEADKAKRYGHRAVRIPGGFVLIIGGFDPTPVRTLVVYDPVDGLFKPAGDMPSGAGLYDFTATSLPDGRVLIAGGRNEIGAKVDNVYIARVDPIDGRVTVVATDSMQFERAGHTAALLGDGTVLVVGGVDVAEGMEDADAFRAERYNPPSAGRR